LNWPLILVGGAVLAFGAYEAAQLAAADAAGPSVTPTSPQGAVQTFTSWFSDVTTGGQPQTSPSVDVETLARTIYGEARGAGEPAMQAVASVVMNRVRNGRFPGGTSVAGVCRAPFQFSCWNSNDPNLKVILAVLPSNPVFAECLQIAQEAVSGGLSDSTGGALYYHDDRIGTPSAWGQVEQTASIGGLEFYA
jgi:spore germination cell wall hydrolase CwlJ-like protein